MNKKTVLLAISAVVILSHSNLYAQPYVYFPKFLEDDARYAQLYRHNFASGIDEISLADTLRITGWRSDTYSKYAAISIRGHLIIYNSEIRKKSEEFSRPAEEIGNVTYAENINKLFVSFWSSIDDENTAYTYVLDGNTFNILHGTSIDITGGAFLSEDESLICYYDRDTLGSKFINTFSTLSYNVMDKIPFNRIGFDTEMKLLHSGAKGKALMGYVLSTEKNSIFAHYQMVDMKTLQSYPNIPITYKSEAQLTPDARYVVVEEVGYGINSLGNDNPRPGKVSIYDAISGKLVSHVQLPEDGRVRLFDGYPKKIFYYIEKSSSSITLDIDSLATKNVGLVVEFINSTGAKLIGGSLQYYEGSWKDAINNNDGTFSINTTQHTLSLRMTYAYGTQTKSNVSVGSDTVVFQTVAAQVKLQNSQSSLIDTGSVQYYAGAWRDFGPTVNGIATKELLPVNYSFRMTYAFASNDKAQDLSANSTVTFQTVNTSVQLKDSQGNLIDQGTVQYYSGAWRNFGVTASGVATKELLPNNYSFRMTYAYASNDKQQDLNSNPTVVFQTVNAIVQLKNSQGNPIDTGTVQYYSGAWRTFGTTTNGATAKELLPNNYSFRMTYAFASNDKQQNIGANSTVVFQTVNASVQLKNSQGSLIDQGTVQYYSGAWRDFGATTGGTTAKELLPNSYQFRMTFAYVSNDKTQDVGSNNIVSYSTVLTTVRVKDSLNNPVNNAIVTYYSGAWRQFGNTVNGDITKELLPANLQFRAKLGSVQQDKTQSLSTNPLVEISLNLVQ